jgi:hypothetical protein
MEKIIPNLDLSPFDFKYDPFSDLDAAKDPHLTEYLLIPKTALIAQKDMPAVIFAPPGGGKTALRLYTERSQLDLSGRTFTITYIPDPDQDIPSRPDLDGHLDQIARASAKEILFRIIANPGQFLDMSPKHQATLAGFLDAYSPIDFSYVILILRTGEPDEISTLMSDLLGRLPPRFHSQETDRSQELARSLAALREHTGRNVSSSTGQFSFLELCDLIMNAFQAREIFVLLDGLDGSTESKRFLERTAGWVLPLFEAAQGWEARRIFLKAFLTTEILPALSEQLRQWEIDLPTSSIQWDDTLLAEVVRLRVSAASETRFSSLDGISALDLRETELQIARQLPESLKLPREIILIVQQTLRHSLERRQAGQPAQIQRQDVLAALDWYSRLPNRALRRPITF